MRAPESPFERYMSKRIVFFAYLINVFLRFWDQSAKKRVYDLPYSWSVKSYRIFSKKDKKKNMECSNKNRSHGKNISKEKIRRHVFVVCVLIYPLWKFGGNRTNSLWVLAFYRARFKWKNWFEKPALNMSIRWVIFTSGQNLKPPFLC